jgi:hypothetical protein
MWVSFFFFLLILIYLTHPINWLNNTYQSLSFLKITHMIGELSPTIHLTNPISFILWWKMINKYTISN